MAEKSKRGGKRIPGEGKKLGRPKSQRPVDGNVARKIKARVQAEELWVFLIAHAAQKALKTDNTADLRNALEYLDNRDWGNTVDNVNHMHDKPMEMTVTVKMSELIREVRERKLQYERNRS